MTTKIHPSAIIHEGAEIDQDVEVGPFCIVGSNVKIGKGTKLHSHVIIDGHTTIAEDNEFFPFCSIGAAPQDLSYKQEPSEVIIGKNNVFREYVSIHRGTIKENQRTVVGSNCFLMSYVHLGHDVQLGNKCIIANSCNFAGHVKMGDNCVVGGGTQISQFVKVGRGCFLAGAAGVDRDILPFCTAIGDRAKLKGINIVGMKRNGIDREMISQTVDFFRLMESSSLSPISFIADKENMKEYTKNTTIQEIAEHIVSSKVGVATFITS
jgi:UDP-N-acetylglucosamine acyltransferase